MTFKECLVVLLMGIWILVFPPKAFSAPLDPRSTAVIYNMAQALSKYKLPDIAPVVEYVSQERLNALVCKKACPQLGAAQVGGHVYILDTLDMDDPFSRAILMHEFVHVLQENSKGLAKDCADWLAREEEAYGLQSYVLDKIGLRLRIPTLSCI